MEKEKKDKDKDKADQPKRKRTTSFVDVDIFDPNVNTKTIKKRISDTGYVEKITSPAGSGAYSNDAIAIN